jgi:hypothetical protein
LAKLNFLDGHHFGYLTKSLQRKPWAPCNSGSHQNPSKSFCSHQVPKHFPIKFLLFPSITHQNPFVLISSQTLSIKFLLFPPITHQNPFVLIKISSNSFCSHQVPFVCTNFLVFPTQPYINPHEALNFGIKSCFFFCNLKTWFLRWFHGERKMEKKKWLMNIIILRNVASMKVKRWASRSKP